MISVWPRFMEGSRYYRCSLKNGWFEHLADGTPTNGLPYDNAGSDIDTTNPEAARWYWDIIRDNLGRRDSILSGRMRRSPTCLQTAAISLSGRARSISTSIRSFTRQRLYDGFRRDLNHRALILSRDAYLACHATARCSGRRISRRPGIRLSGRYQPGWMWRRPALRIGATILADGNICRINITRAQPPLLDPSDARDNVGGYDDFPELYTRWFEYAAFLPIFRTHGSRNYNEVWCYGKQAEPILEKYLRLRYQLLPYIYSLS